MAWLDVLKSLIYGIVEGVTEWLPISSTGHLILLERLLPFTAGGNAANNSHFFSFYLVVVQLGAVMAVVVTFWPQLWPFPRKHKALPDHEPGDLTDFRLASRELVVDHRILRLWVMILVACVPAAIVGVLFDDKIEAVFYNPLTVAIMLILVGLAFLVVELVVRKRRQRKPIQSLEAIDYRVALIIGLFQLIAAILPGTSRSGATILGGLLIGMTRPLAATFTFFLAVPVMAGASLLKLLKLGAHFNLIQWLSILVGMGTAYLVSILIIKFLLSYIRRHDFRIFAFYRILLGLVIIGLFLAGIF
ncbi:MAG: undecaprenyl-diphosphate phosphatase [Clostridiaceae bacterium]|nr:undecaprenyl-diphosphate phosphatase [Clostridiaceae bacterium]